MLICFTYYMSIYRSILLTHTYIYHFINLCANYVSNLTKDTLATHTLSHPNYTDHNTVHQSLKLTPYRWDQHVRSCVITSVSGELCVC